MEFDNKRDLAENKLILLYIIDKIDLPVSNLQITKIILENNYMNYFFFQQFLNELCENSLISAHIIDNKTLYKITQNGKQTLNYFVNHIPFGIKSRIDSTISSIRKNVKNETLVTADYMPESENEYIVTCRVHEDNFSLMDLKVTVGTKTDAQLICTNWKKYSQMIYSELINNLIKKRD